MCLIPSAQRTGLERERHTDAPDLRHYEVTVWCWKMEPLALMWLDCFWVLQWARVWLQVVEEGWRGVPMSPCARVNRPTEERTSCRVDIWATKTKQHNKTEDFPTTALCTFLRLSHDEEKVHGNGSCCLPEDRLSGARIVLCCSTFCLKWTILLDVQLSAKSFQRLMQRLFLDHYAGISAS